MREQILKLLKQNVYISGERIATNLSISRAGVWKHINLLRKKGYQIVSSPHKGYCLLQTADSIIPEAITIDLGTQKIGRRVIYYEELKSTQDVADRLARRGEGEGLVVISGRQTQGRGRKARAWLSPALGGIYLSIILKPNISPVNAVQIPMVAGVALARAIRMVTKLPAEIKWPNDIHIGERKVAGILTEINCEVDRVNYIILGIGINVNTEIASLAVQGNVATSLAHELGGNVSRVELIRKFLVEFEIIYFKFIRAGLDSLLSQWRSLNNTLGAQVKVSDEGFAVAGKALDIDGDGFLLVEDGSGKIHRIISGDVSLRVQQG